MLILVNVGWDRLVAAVETHYGAGGFNPFVNPDMGWSYVIFNLLGRHRPPCLTWQTTIARVLAAKDSRTGMKVYTRTSFFFVCRFLIPGIWGIAALAVLGPGAHGQRHAPRHAAVPGHLRARRTDGHPDRRDAGRRHEHRFVLHAHLGQRHLQRHHARRSARPSGPTTKGLLVNRFIVAVHRRLPAVLRPVVPAAGRPVDLSDRDRRDLPDEHVDAVDRGCYWRRANDWGAAGAIVVGAVVPVLTLVLQKVGPLSQRSGSSTTAALCGIAAYVLCWVAMIVGSLLKPLCVEPDGSTGGTVRHEGRCMMMGEHWFWWLLTMACVVWYSTITVYVAIRGAVDIKTCSRAWIGTRSRGTSRPARRLADQVVAPAELKLADH